LRSSTLAQLPLAIIQGHHAGDDPQLATSAVPGLWQPSLEQSGEVAEHASVCEVTQYLKLSTMPTGTRCIVRREPLHPGAQRSLFPSDEFRYWGFYTDADGDPVQLDVIMPPTLTSRVTSND
jgi:hypothetical protein